MESIHHSSSQLPPPPPQTPTSAQLLNSIIESTQTAAATGPFALVRDTTTVGAASPEQTFQRVAKSCEFQASISRREEKQQPLAGVWHVLIRASE